MLTLVCQQTDIVVIYFASLKESSSLCFTSVAYFNEKFACELNDNSSQIQVVEEAEHVVFRFESRLRIELTHHMVNGRMLLLSQWLIGLGL